jgi:hypothetical protein
LFQSKQLKEPQLHMGWYTTLRQSFLLKTQLAQAVLRAVVATYKYGHLWRLVQLHDNA